MRRYQGWKANGFMILNIETCGFAQARLHPQAAKPGIFLRSSRRCCLSSSSGHYGLGRVTKTSLSRPVSPTAKEIEIPETHILFRKPCLYAMCGFGMRFRHAVSYWIGSHVVRSYPVRRRLVSIGHAAEAASIRLAIYPNAL